MEFTQGVANQIAADIHGEDNPTVAIDPATIMAIISVIIQVVKMYRECKKSPAQAKESMSSPGFLNRWKLKRLAKSAVADQGASVSADDVYNGVLRHGGRVTISDVTQLYQEV
jgi:hypothetical protein